jgi:hypothetical protein
MRKMKKSEDEVNIDRTIVIVVGCLYDSGFMSDLDADLFAIPPSTSERWIQVSENEISLILSDCVLNQNLEAIECYTANSLNISSDEINQWFPIEVISKTFHYLLAVNLVSLARQVSLSLESAQLTNCQH